MKKKYIIVLFIISISLIVYIKLMSFGKLEESYSVTESNEYNDINKIEYFSSGSYILVNRDDLWYSIIKDWIESKKYEDILNIKYSKNWKNYSFIAKKGWKDIFVKDWVEGEKYDTIYDFDVSSDWEKYIFSAVKDWKNIIVINWFESEAYDMVYDLDISEYLDNYTFNTYIVRKKDFYLLIKDWAEQKIIQEKDNKYIYSFWKQKLEYDYIDSIRLIQWGKSFVFVAKKGEKYVVVKDWIEIGSYDNIVNNMSNNIMSNFDISLDKSSFSFIAQKDKKQVLVKDWVESEEYDKINNLIINSGINIPVNTVNHICYWYLDDSKNYLFKAEVDWKWLVVNDWIESEKYDKISDINCFENTKSYSYIAEKNWNNELVNSWIKINKEIKNNINYLDLNDYIYNDGFYSYIVIDWVKSKKYQKVRWFKYLPDWVWFSFIADTKNGQKVINYLKK